jgi:alcohol dehydrogenase
VKSLAALLRQSGEPLPYATTRPLEIVEVDLAPPGAGEVLVKIESAGICHSDLSVVNGTRPRPLPLVAGHESAGVVVELGAGVKSLKVGDHVTSVFLPSCGLCTECTSGTPAFCSVGATSNSRTDWSETLDS